MNGRSRGDWLRVFTELARIHFEFDGIGQGCCSSASDVDAPLDCLDRLALLRGLFEAAGGRRDAMQTRSTSQSVSVNDNLRELCKLFVYARDGPLPAVPAAVAVAGTELTADEWQLCDQIVQNVGIRFPRNVYQGLPAALVNNMRYWTVMNAILSRRVSLSHSFFFIL